MKRTILIGLAGLSASTLGAKPASPAQCFGYYLSPHRESGFSIKIEPTVIELVYVDYSPHDLARYTRNRDGSLTFYIGQGLPSRLRCDSTGATVEFPATTTYLHNPETAIQSPARRVRLVRSTGDIFKYAEKHGWSLD